MKTINICPDFEDLEKLVDGKLSEERSAFLKQHISNCKDCRELYEGLAELGSDYVDNVAEELNDRIDARVAKSKKEKKSILLSLSKYAAAAAIAGLGVLGVYHISMNNNAKDAEIAIVDSENEDKTPKEDAEAMSMKMNTEIADVEDVEVKTNAPAPKNLSTDKAGDFVVDEGNTITMRGSAANSEVSKQLADSQNLSAVKVDMLVLDNKFKKAKALIAAGEYFDAKDEIEDILNLDPDNAEAYKMLGISNMKLKYYNQAIDNFKHCRTSKMTTAQRHEIDSLISICMQNRL